MPCGLISTYRGFEKIVSSFLVSVQEYQEDINIQKRSCENLKFRFSFIIIFLLNFSVEVLITVTDTQHS
jgi:hypothetical protein